MPPKYTSASRIIAGEIIEDKRVNSLPDWLAITAHFRILLRMDNVGRIEADPDMIKSLIFPRQKPVITLPKCQKVVQSLHDEGLFFLYKINGAQYLQAAKYDRQRMVGHMQRKSSLPAPDAKKFLDWLIKVRSDDRFMDEKMTPEALLAHVYNMLGTCIDHDDTCSDHNDNTSPATKGKCTKHVNTTLSPSKNLIKHVNPEQDTDNDTDNDNDNEDDTDTEQESAQADAQGDEGVSVSVHIKSLREKAEKNLDNTSLPKGDRFNKELKSAMEIHGYRNVEEAIKEAVRQNNPRWQYVIGILVNWENERNSRRGK